MFTMSLRGFLAHKGRMALSGVAIALGVAFVTGTLILSDTIDATFTNLFTATAADVTVTPRQAFTPEVEDAGLAGPPATLPAAIVGQIAALPGVAAAHGQVSVQNVTVVDAANQPVGPTSGAPTLGQNTYAGAPVRFTVGRAPAATGEIALDESSAHRAGVKLGDSLRVLTPTGAATPARVVGVAAFTAANPGVGLVLFDTATAQTTLLGKPGVFTAVTLDTAAGADAAAVAARASATLGAGFTVATRQEQAASSAAQIGAFLGVITSVLLGFAGVAVLVGVFLILTTFSMLVAARTRELGLLRALGADRRQVTGSVLLEALLLGVLGSGVGLGVGIGLAALITTVIGQAGVDLSATPLVLTPLTPLAAFVVGIGVTVAAAWLPARRASLIAPMQALREAAAPPSLPLRRRTAGGLALAAVGASALVAASIGHGPLGVAAGLLAVGVLTTLIAAVMLGPVLARGVVSMLGGAVSPLFGTIARLGTRNAVRNPRRTGATAGALMIGLALVGAVSVVAASLNTSITAEVASSFGADYVVSANAAQPIGDATTGQIRRLPGVAAVTRQRYALAQRDGTQVSLSGVDTATIDQAVRTQYLAGSTADIARGALMIDAGTAAADNLRLGSPVTLRFLDTTTATLTVGAISRTPVGGGKDGGTFEVSLDTLARYQPTAHDVTLYVTATKGADPAAVGDALRRSLLGSPQIHVQDRSAYRAQATGQVNLVLRLLYGLLALAVLIAVLGVINTLSLSVVERTREIGLLRAIGTSRRQIRRMIRLESVLVAVHGAFLGLALGLAWGAAGQQVLAGYGITTLAIPWATILTVLAGSALIGLIAAVLPARRTARMNILAAVSAP